MNRSTLDSAADDPPSARVLVVDEDPRELEILSTLLTELGVSVRCSQGLSEATAKLRHVPCDTCLVSLKLPGHGGTDLLRHIRRMYPRVTVVVIAGPEQESVARSSLDEGAFDYLLRPVDAARVVGCVQQACADAAGRGR